MILNMILENANTLQKEPSLDDGYADRALLIFSKECFIRRKCFEFLHTKIYDFLITLILVLANFSLIIETYLCQENVGIKNTNLIVMSDIFFCVLFSFEILIKLIAYGFFTEKKSFLRDLWNFSDALIAFSYFINIFYFQFHIETMNVFSVKIKKKIHKKKNLKQ